MEIKKLLFLRGIKQTRIVKELNISPSVLSLYLNGWRSLPSKYEEALAEFLGVTKKEIAQNSANQGRSTS